MPEKTDSEHHALILEMQRVEVKWAKRCLIALRIFLCLAVGSSSHVVGPEENSRGVLVVWAAKSHCSCKSTSPTLPSLVYRYICHNQHSKMRRIQLIKRQTSSTYI